LGRPEAQHFPPRWASIGGLEATLLAWNRVYEQVRPHQALGYQTPEQFYQDWLLSSSGKQLS